ncbi:MAG: hypothetical protein ACOYT4_05280 [Nanoarchaeota archaeon]
MTKKVGVILIIFLLMLAFTKTITADTNSTNSSLVSPSVQYSENQTKIDQAYKCLEDKITEKDCSELPISEISLSILAGSSSEILKDCKSALQEKKSSKNCWPSNNCNIKDTAIAVLALNYLGEDTSEAEEWLLNQNKTSTDLDWYLEQDSEGQTECKISYNENNYPISIDTNKKLSSGAGNCLVLSSSGFWLQVVPSCYDQTFTMSCNKQFISTMFYKQKNDPSSPFFILADTPSAPAEGTIELKIKTKCFGMSSCSYEETAWASLALLETGHDISSFIPYLMATADLDVNKKYEPNAFIYLVTNYDEYAVKLIQEQKIESYWEAPSSAYGKYYDTALALLSLKESTSNQVLKSKDWLMKVQSKSGCWGDSIRDTAMILWAIGGRAPKISEAGVTYCIDANYFCIQKSECPQNQQLENYFCSGLASVCCKEENLKTCEQMNGHSCNSAEYCTGEQQKSSDIEECCIGACKKSSPASLEQTECEEKDYYCRTECSDNQEEADYDCGEDKVCCKPSGTSTPTNSKIWIWILIAGIVIVAGAIIYLLRDKIKLMWFKSKVQSEESPASSTSPYPPYPPKPGFPPVRRTPAIPQKSNQQPIRKDKQMDETFKKLREMSK